MKKSLTAFSLLVGVAAFVLIMNSVTTPIAPTEDEISPAKSAASITPIVNAPILTAIDNDEECRHDNVATVLLAELHTYVEGMGEPRPCPRVVRMYSTVCRICGFTTFAENILPGCGVIHGTYEGEEEKQDIGIEAEFVPAVRNMLFVDWSEIEHETQYVNLSDGLVGKMLIAQESTPYSQYTPAPGRFDFCCDFPIIYTDVAWERHIFDPNGDNSELCLETVQGRLAICFNCFEYEFSTETIPSCGGNHQEWGNNE
ncbi:MAG: hypothetical protein FWD01_01595 [Defluviitaleaceae bacterium]|nr:hypothetical protein [Defluviitaleaceae bacterium]